MVSGTRKILVFGFDGIEDVKFDSGELIFVGKDFENNLAEFDIIVYIVGTFNFQYERTPFLELVLKGAPPEAIRRENEIGLALEKGKTVCFVGKNQYDYVVSGILKSYNVYYEKTQRSEVFRNLQVRRSEFKSFLDDVGASESWFAKDSVDDLICLADNFVVGFSKKVKNGLLLFLPCIWGSDKISYVVDHLEKLVTGLVAYSTKLIVEPPSYIEQFQFGEEEITRAKIEKIKKEHIEPLQKTLGLYNKMKSILWLGNKPLVDATNGFLENMGFQTLIDEVFEEDLWIMNDAEKLIIVEIKGLNKNLTRQDISKLDEHREAREAPNLTGLLIANTFMAADSFQNKDQPFPPNVIEKAVHSNLIITRTIDLARIFDHFEQQSAKYVLEIVLEQKGWLTFQDGKIQLISS